MGTSFPGESQEYRDARDRLLEREVELRRAMEAVSRARRELPAGGVVPEDYVFDDGSTSGVRLSELFSAGRDSLVIYSFMFPRDPNDDRPGPASGESAALPLAEAPCPSELFYAPTDADQDTRHVGTLEPLWNLFDLTPEGRQVDWDEQITYE
jgi:predicted dithiol-disulfide oxidoreductase (DUF899 family)